MMPGMDMKKIKKLMKGMENIPAERVVIEGPKKIIIENPQVMKINMMGQETFQIIGKAREETAPEISKEDVELVANQTGKDENEVRKLLEKNGGDIAKTILELKSNQG